MSKNLAKSSIILIIFTLLSKVLVIFRDMAMATVLGASSLSDAYITATTILSLVSVAALSALTVAYIPIVSGKNDRELAYVTNNFMTVLSSLTLLLTIFALFFTREIVQLFASGFSPETIEYTQLVLRIVMPVLFLSVVISITNAYLQYRGSFWYQGFSAIITNIIIIASVIISQRNLQTLSIGYVLSIVVPAIIGLILAHRKGLRLKPSISLNNQYLRELLVLSLPIFASQILIQLNIIIDKNFASNVGLGIVTNLDYAHKIANLLIGTIVPSIATVLYPTLSQRFAEKQMFLFSDTLGRGLGTAVFISFPMMAGTMLLSQPIVNFLFLRGNYTVEAVGITSDALFYYAIGMLPLGLIYILNNGFFAMKDTKTPLYCGAPAILLNIVLNKALVGPLSYKGLAIATSIAYILNAALYFVGMRKRIGNRWLQGFGTSFSKTLVATCVMSICVLVGKTVLASWLNSGGVLGILGCIFLAFVGFVVYIFVCLLMKVEAVFGFLDVVRRKH